MIDVTLPVEFVHHPSDHPSVIYWAYGNELSKDIGLDFSAYSGQGVHVYLFKIAESLPKSTSLGGNRAVVITHEGKIVGAWIDSGCYCADGPDPIAACSLKRRSRQEITGETWNEWVATIVDFADLLEQELAQLSPAELIHHYYDSLIAGNLRQAYACESRHYLVEYLFVNKDEDSLYNPTFEEAFIDGKRTSPVQVETVERLRWYEEMMGFSGERRNYEVLLTRAPQPPSEELSPSFLRSFDLVRRWPNLGWRIERIGRYSFQGQGNKGFDPKAFSGKIGGEDLNEIRQVLEAYFKLREITVCGLDVQPTQLGLLEQSVCTAVLQFELGREEAYRIYEKELGIKIVSSAVEAVVNSFDTTQDTAMMTIREWLWIDYVRPGSAKSSRMGRGIDHAIVLTKTSRGWLLTDDTYDEGPITGVTTKKPE